MFRVLEPSLASVGAALRGHRRVLLTGPPGVGKSTLAARLAAWLARERQTNCACLGFDLGSPAFGMPGAVCLAEWRDDAWALVDFEPVCSLDAARFRLPLTRAVGRVLRRASAPPLVLLDGPGLVRGVAAAELTGGIIEEAEIDLVLAIARAGRPVELDDELIALGVAVYRLPAAEDAQAPGKRARTRQRTARWNDYLLNAVEQRIDLDAVRCLGTPPPRDAPSAWAGRQIALLRGRDCVGFGELSSLDGSSARARVNGATTVADTLLVRDAQRGANGLLNTAVRFAADVEHLPRSAPTPPTYREVAGPRPVAKVGPFVAALINGVFGDPLLHVRLQHARRSLLFDLGDPGRLPARIAHQVTDIFISHAHVDHVAGFLWFLRSRIGAFAPCRIFGPPGLAQNIAGMVAGIHWDRAGERGPRFEVTELHGAERALRFTVSTTEERARGAGEAGADGGVLLAEPALRVRAAVLDHRTPVLAFALEPSLEVKVRKERLAALRWAPGPWLTVLKSKVLEGELDATIELPNHSRERVGLLADELLIVRPGDKLVYATDLADTAENRALLGNLAHGAHTLFCEAMFCEAEAEQAARTGHLTARACGEIAAAAGVERLVPFHFSRRYGADPAKVYREVRAACSRTVMPRWLRAAR